MSTVNEALGVSSGPAEIKTRVPLIILVGADKGGVGKTTVSRALMDYLYALHQQVRAFDTEPGDGVLKRFYPETTMLKAETIPGQMEVIDSARSNAVTVVDCKAGLLGPILKVFHRIDLLSDVRSGKLNLLVLHVIGSNAASTSEIKPVIDQLKGANLVRVNNMMSPDDVFAPDVPGEMTITVPNLEVYAAKAVDDAGLGFRAFVEKGTSRVQSGYVNAWLHDVHRALDAGGVGALLKEPE